MDTPVTERTRDIGKSIRRLRRARDLNQESLADAVGVSRNWISNIERGWPCSRTVLSAILEFLNVPDAKRLAREIDDGSETAVEMLRTLGRAAIGEVEAKIGPLQVPETDPEERSRYMGFADREGKLWRVGDTVIDQDGVPLIGDLPIICDPDETIFDIRVALAETEAAHDVIKNLAMDIALHMSIVNSVKTLIVDCNDLIREITATGVVDTEKLRFLWDLYRPVHDMVTDLESAWFAARRVRSMANREPVTAANTEYVSYHARMSKAEEDVKKEYTPEQLARFKQAQVVQHLDGIDVVDKGDKGTLKPLPGSTKRSGRLVPRIPEPKGSGLK